MIEFVQDDFHATRGFDAAGNFDNNFDAACNFGGSVCEGDETEIGCSQPSSQAGSGVSQGEENLKSRPSRNLPEETLDIFNDTTMAYSHPDLIDVHDTGGVGIEMRAETNMTERDGKGAMESWSSGIFDNTGDEDFHAIIFRTVPMCSPNLDRLQRYEYPGGRNPYGVRNCNA